jgi:hypothetical protein
MIKGGSRGVSPGQGNGGRRSKGMLSRDEGDVVQAGVGDLEVEVGELIVEVGSWEFGVWDLEPGWAGLIVRTRGNIAVLDQGHQI